MGKHTHAMGEKHITQTWGLRFIEHRTIVWTLRTRPGRVPAMDKPTSKHMARVLERWVDRYAERRDLVVTSMDVAVARDNRQPEETVDTVVLAFRVHGPFPHDWMCFSDIAVRMAESQPMILPPILAQMVPPPGLFDLEVEREDEEAEPPIH